MFLRLVYCLMITVIFWGTTYLHSEQQNQENTVMIHAVDILTQWRQTQSVWPQFDLNAMPTVFVFPSGNIYALLFQSAKSEWQHKKIGKQDVLFTHQDVWGLRESPLNPHFMLEGNKVFVFPFMEPLSSEEQALRVWIHERFHLHQDHYFTQEGQFQPDYSDYLNPLNLTLLESENRALIAFAKEPSRERLKDYLALNKIRRSELSPTSFSWELNQQRIEGLADYVSYQAWTEIFHTPQTAALIASLEIPRQEVLTDWAIKWRHYGVGAALAQGLDFLQVEGWKEQVTHGKDLLSLLELSLPLSQEEALQRVAEFKKRDPYESRYKENKEHALLKEKELNSLLKSYERLQGVILHVALPSAMGCTGSGIAQKNVQLPNGSILSLNDSSVIVTTDSFWKMQFSSIPFVMLLEEGQKEFKEDDTLLLIVDGQSYLLKDIFEHNIHLNFTTISWKGKYSEFSCLKHQGQVFIKDQKVCIAFLGQNSQKMISN